MTNTTIDVIVKEIKRETPKVKSFLLAALDGSPLPRFSPGAHITTTAANGKQQLERHYSLTNPPEKRDAYQIAIRLNEQSKGGSAYWHQHIKTGDMLKISYPRNHFPLSFKAKHHVFFAAGIGITPFLTMAAELKSKGKSFELHYASPAKELCPFYSFLNEEYHNETTFYFSKEKQKITVKIMENQRVGTHVYFCGPEAMVKEYKEAAKGYGYPEESIHFELFSPPDFGESRPFQVKLQKSNVSLQVPKEKSLLETLLDQGINAPYSCKAGGCGSCQVDVLKGEVEHRDVFLSDAEKKEGNVILTCVSRAKTETLIIDL